MVRQRFDISAHLHVELALLQARESEEGQKRKPNPGSGRVPAARLEQP